MTFGWQKGNLSTRSWYCQVSGFLQTLFFIYLSILGFILWLILAPDTRGIRYEFLCRILSLLRHVRTYKSRKRFEFRFFFFRFFFFFSFRKFVNLKCTWKRIKRRWQIDYLEIYRRWRFLFCVLSFFHYYFFDKARGITREGTGQKITFSRFSWLTHFKRCRFVF